MLTTYLPSAIIPIPLPPYWAPTYRILYSILDDDEDSETVNYQDHYEDDDDDNQQKYLYQEELSVYKAVCDNIKHTLAQIKGYSKVTLMSDPKASYFTIVDAVLSGPQALNPDELISVLGVS